MKHLCLAVLFFAVLSLHGGHVSTAQAAAEPKVESGTLNGANFRIEIPAQWNKGLVMYCHGYALAGSQPSLDGGKPLRDAFLSSRNRRTACKAGRSKKQLKTPKPCGATSWPNTASRMKLT